MTTQAESVRAHYQAAIADQKALLIRIATAVDAMEKPIDARRLAPLDQFHMGGLAATAAIASGAASIADCALVPVLNAVTLLGAIHDRSDVIASHARLGDYWATAQRDPVNAALLAEQLAGLPTPLQGFAGAAAARAAA